MTLPLPIGYSDFRDLRERGLVYVDKTALIAELLAAPHQVVLLPRPRRFGKTLNLSTLRHFLECPQPKEGEPTQALTAREALFMGLAVWQEGPDIRKHFAAYPLIWLTFKDVKLADWDDCRTEIARLIGDEVERLLPQFRQVLTEGEQALVDQFVSRRAQNPLTDVLRRLSAWLHRATGRRTVILIDEYDTPLHAAYFHGYHDQATELFRNLLSGAFKDNVSLERGVLTGILRVAKESLFSGLNNLAVHTLLSKPFSTSFGFTQDEVACLARDSGCPEALPELERWYNGYRFGGETIYNPWSTLNYLAEPSAGCKPYWVNTASDELLRELLVHRGVAELPDLEALLHGGAVTKAIDEHINLRDVERSADALWSFLLFSGYLRATPAPGRDLFGASLWHLEVPNREVAFVYTKLFGDALATGLGGTGRLQSLSRAVLTGDAEEFEALLCALLAETLSFFDLAARPAEAVYQAFVAGLLVILDATHEVSTNREAGHGRYDVLVAPRQPGGAGAVLELKVLNERHAETVEQALQSALAQVESRDYAAGLRSRGAATIQTWGVVFQGKRAYVRGR